jgi:hypothetical protein
LPASIAYLLEEVQKELSQYTHEDGFEYWTSLFAEIIGLTD